MNLEQITDRAKIIVERGELVHTALLCFTHTGRMAGIAFPTDVIQVPKEEIALSRHSFGEFDRAILVHTTFADEEHPSVWVWLIERDGVAGLELPYVVATEGPAWLPMRAAGDPPEEVQMFVEALWPAERAG